MILPLQSIHETDLIKGVNLMINIAGPFNMLCKPKASLPVTCDSPGSNRERVKLYVLMAIDMYTHQVETAVMDCKSYKTRTCQMRLGRWTQLWQRKCCTAYARTFKSGQKHAKASFRQSNVESSVHTFKRTLNASIVPPMSPLTVVSFTRCVAMSTAVMNLRPIVLIPRDSATPTEITSISPQTLRGPWDAE